MPGLHFKDEPKVWMTATMPGITSFVIALIPTDGPPGVHAIDECQGA
jgi:hypothetical protein